MASKFSASRAPSSTAGLFKSAPGTTYTQPTPNPGRGSLQSGIPGSTTTNRFGWETSTPAQAAYGPTIQGTGGHTYRKLEGGGYVNESGEKVSGFSTPGKASGGGGGGGGYVMPQQQAAPLDFFMGQTPELKKLEIPLEEYSKMLGKVNNPEELAALSERYNAPTKKAFESNMPFFDASLAALGGQALDALQGRVSRSTAQSVARSVAQANLGSGLAGGIMGAMGGLGRNMVFRDLAKASEAAVDRGINALGQSLGFFQQKQAMASPTSVSSLMVNPAAIYDTLQTQAQSNWNTANANLINAWQSQARPGQFDITTGKYVGYQPGERTQYAPLRPEAQRDKDLRDKVADLNSRAYAGRFSVRGDKIFDSYSGRTI